MFCTPASLAAVLQNTSGPVFANPFPAHAATGRRFVERHTVAVQQNISCPVLYASRAPLCRHSETQNQAGVIHPTKRNKLLNTLRP